EIEQDAVWRRHRRCERAPAVLLPRRLRAVTRRENRDQTGGCRALFRHATKRAIREGVAGHYAAMRTPSRALSWIVLGTVAFGCGGGGTSGSGTAGTSGGTGVAGTSGAARGDGERGTDG